MNNFYKGGRGLAFSQREGRASLRKEKPPRLTPTVTDEVREGGDAFGTSAVQYLYPFSSTTTQAQPKDHLRMTQGSPKNDPRTTQESPKPNPRITQAQPSLRRGYRQGSPKDSTRNTQETANNDTKKPRLMYRECTVSVRGLYRKGTTEVLRRYWEGTNDIPTACTSPVHPDRRDGEVLVGLETHGHASVRNQDVPQHNVCDIRRGEISFAQFFHALFRMRANNYCLRRALRGSPLPLLLIFICCLFNNAALAQSQDTLGAVNGVGSKKIGHQSHMYTNQYEIKRISSDPKFDLQQYPMYKYEIDQKLINPVRIGDPIPSELMDMPLWAITRDSGSDTIRLRDYADDQLLIVDFWASWCAPCISSMEKWESYVDSIGEGVRLLGVHIDYDYKAFPFVKDRQWRAPSVIGMGAYVLNRHFFDRPVISRIAWIKGGCLLAITGTEGYDLPMVRNILAGEAVDMPIDHTWTYTANEN